MIPNKSMTQHLPFLLAILPPREGALKQSSCGASPWRDMTRPSVKRQVALRVDSPALKVGQGAAAEDRRLFIVKSMQTPGIITYPRIQVGHDTNTRPSVIVAKNPSRRLSNFSDRYGRLQHRPPAYTSIAAVSNASRTDTSCKRG